MTMTSVVQCQYLLYAVIILSTAVAYQRNLNFAGLGFGNSFFQTGPESQNFFNMISKVPLNFNDIEAMYSNISLQMTTQKCEGICRTPVALWVLNNLTPCHDISKEDCPVGLVCCQLPPVEPVNAASKRSDFIGDEIEDSGRRRILEWNEDEFAASFKQDPIPGDTY